jgi:cyclic dehypoxanthinyl futalosine synthase
VILSSNNLGKQLQIDAVITGDKRLTVEAAQQLYDQASLHDLGRWSTAMADRIMGDRYKDTYADASRVRGYVIDRNVNYTNICTANCTFCAFKRQIDQDDAYLLSTEQLHAKIAELCDIGGTQVLLQGGMHPKLGIDYYEEMLRGIKSRFPDLHVHGFSPPEFVEFVGIFDLEGFATTEPGKSDTLGWDSWCAKLEVIMGRLVDAGLDSIPGGGGEIFAPPVRKRIGLGKADTRQWLEVMSCAHRLGMSTSATMMFGHIEGVADRIDHLHRVREAQDRAINQGWPGRYVSFISWPFQRENTPMGRLPDWDADSEDPFPGDLVARGEDPSSHPLFGKRVRMSSATDYLRTSAISRLFLDNIHSIGSSWVTMGPHIGQLALFYGATDMGSVMMEENVVSAAGTTYCLNEATICRLIRDAGYIPAQRGNAYNLLKIHDGPKSPDLQVKDWSAYRADRLHIEGDEAPAESAGGSTDGVQLPVVQPSDLA